MGGIDYYFLGAKTAVFIVTISNTKKKSARLDQYSFITNNMLYVIILLYNMVIVVCYYTSLPIFYGLRFVVCKLNLREKSFLNHSFLNEKCKPKRSLEKSRDFDNFLPNLSWSSDLQLLPSIKLINQIVSLKSQGLQAMDGWIFLFIRFLKSVWNTKLQIVVILSFCTITY